MNGAPVVVDHLQLLVPGRHWRAAVEALATAIDCGVAVDLVVEHEADGCCCRREPWDATLRGLVGETVRRSAAV